MQEYYLRMQYPWMCLVPVPPNLRTSDMCTISPSWHLISLIEINADLTLPMRVRFVTTSAISRIIVLLRKLYMHVQSTRTAKTTVEPRFIGSINT